MPKVKILIVEDEKIVAMDIQKSLETMGYFVCATASSGEEAVQKAGETRPDLTLMDIVLKGEMDGIMAAEQINALFKIPIVYLTAYDDEDILQRAKITTPYGYIIKPFNDRELRIAIEVALYKKQAEDRIRKTELWLAAVLRSVGDAVIASDRVGRITFMNQMAKKLTGREEEEVLGKKLTEVLDIKDEKLGDLEKHLVEKVITQGLIINLLEDHMLVAKDGTEIPVSDSVAPIRDDDGETAGTVLVFRDITERKQGEEALRESEVKFRTLVEQLPQRVFIKDRNSVYITCNRNYSCDLEIEVEAIAGKTDFEFYPKELADRYRSDDQRVITSGTIEAFEEKYINFGQERWVHTTKAPYRDKNGNIVGVIGIFEDISERKGMEEELQHGTDRLRKALGATVQAVAAVVEARDPYTAGHQRKVADLARAIATEMGLTTDQIEGTHAASTIHDIGKISVPAEILSKPTKLSGIEFSLIKVHSQSGYDILKDIDFPWPVARIVLEHHEKMDGSGYPQGLPGDKLLVESRIIAVADVVEAIASHRPYRPGLGIDKALDEISKNKGILYDREVVDACLRLFNEKGYNLER